MKVLTQEFVVLKKDSGIVPFLHTEKSCFAIWFKLIILTGSQEEETVKRVTIL